MGTDHVDRQRVHATVQALLRKAESTPFPAEADAFMAKAQQLLTRHALDEVVADHDHGAAPVVRRVPVDGAYATGRALLLATVASANRCTAVWDAQATTAMVVGFAVDIDAVDLLWTSLVTQGELAVAAAGPQRDARGRSCTRSWRSAFWVSYSQRIGQRLAEAADAVVAEVADDAVLPVLADRGQAVDAAVRQHFPRLATRRTRVSNGDGWSAGRRAADAARLGGHRSVTPG